jgi:protein TonB
MRSLCFALLVPACALFAQTAGEPADARGWLDRGVTALKSAKFAEATEAFQRAVDLDPFSGDARDLLATTFFEQYKEGDSSPENRAFADKARAGFEQALALDPGDKLALSHLASLAWQEASGTSDPDAKLRRLDDAQSWHKRLVIADPRNREAWYRLGAIDWMKWHPKWLDALQQAGMKPDEPGRIADDKLRRDLRSTSGQLVEDGISNLSKALEIDPQDPEAMAGMNLLVRERACTDDSTEQYQKDVALADDWAQKAAAAKIARATPPARIRVGGNVQAANLITKVVPRYPKDAKKAGIQGTVRFQAILGHDGRVQSLQLVSGPPLLVDAARDAVQQWVYRPTLLNGQPVEVVTTIDVNFILGPP